MSEIVLSTLNARYIHASLGLRYLRANLGEFRDRAVIREFTIKRPVAEIVAEILQEEPCVVGFGVYIWNTDHTQRVIEELRRLRPALLILAGGPEISFEIETQPLYRLVDYIFKGEADHSLRDFVRAYFGGGLLPAEKVIHAPLPAIHDVALPYGEFSDDDLKNRVLYVEASRGCPYKCEYCLSALDVSVRNFATENFLNEMQTLIDRGARQFKFVDRTFNLAPAISARILEFFLARVHLGLFLHFEMVPDRLPDGLKLLIRQFPKGALQFEIGIQTWNPEVARHVSRRQNYTKIAENFRFLKNETGVHTHADLIVGLPGETLASFARGFDALYALMPDEIQVGLLKRLKGTPVIRHAEPFAMVYAQGAPFQIRSTKDCTADEIDALKVFADFWDAVANSGRFPGLKAMVTDGEAFAFYFRLSQWLFARFQRTHSIHLPELQRAVDDYLAERGHAGLTGLRAPAAVSTGTPSRQSRHLAPQV